MDKLGKAVKAGGARVVQRKPEKKQGEGKPLQTNNVVSTSEGALESPAENQKLALESRLHESKKKELLVEKSSAQSKVNPSTYNPPPKNISKAGMNMGNAKRKVIQQPRNN
mmetsp:Transcript_2455/g.3590  ORF Transcript_2455/g.3590 Transcript_2455/m.3590 type:complete len:111 (-) Transcript_2455:295-627(-)